MFKQRKNKTFNYQSRRFGEKPIDSDLEISKQKEFSSKWIQNRESKIKSTMSIRTLIFVLLLLLICMYVLEKKYM